MAAAPPAASGTQGGDVAYRARYGEEPVDPAHAEDEAGQARLVQVEADTDVPAPDDGGPKPDLVTEDDGSGVAGGSSGSSSGGSGMPGHPDAPR
ncbi:hypothetical protein GCM10023176_41900 [Micromonospora coerulea]|jgi:hypothetical protein|uniref:Preprotein translocase YidC n=1 Tax=Micromonospora coerulea TaxID=47856 RepID=A0ABP8SW87_9ACTN